MRTIKVAAIAATLLGSGFDGLAASDNVTDRTASVAVGAQYDSTHVYVAWPRLEDGTRFAKELICPTVFGLNYLIGMS